MDKQAKILEIIRIVAKKDLTPAADESLFDSGLIDSFALADMVDELESAFGVTVPDSDLNPRKFDTIEKIEQYLNEH